EAERLGLRTAAKADSQDICFVGQGDYRELVRRLAPAATESGRVVDADGTVLGSHDGVMGFTVGQRRGLGVAVGEPRFVVELRPDRREVVVGRRADLEAIGAVVGGVSFVAGHPPTGDEGLAARIRYRAEPTPLTALAGEGDRWEARFAAPQPAVAPGQTLTVYAGDEVVGGGIIEAPVRS
ncbi:MAG: tRNA methyl transferase PRC-barrel domain-containing protein, partial [Acidimicrobiia bacterium]